MVNGSNVRPKMALVLLNLLCLVQLQTLFAKSNGLLGENDCGVLSVSLWSTRGRALFYLNGELVDKGLFCKALQLYDSNHCFSFKKLRNRYCRLNLALGMDYYVFTWFSV